MDLGDWLRSLGLSQYETLFRQNDIDAEVLSELTDGDLEKFGVSLGHRMRLLKAIASLGSTETAAKPATPVPLQTSPDVAERRQLTVMFCDLVGSTAMSARLDPEDMREIIGAYHRCCAGLIERNGGFVAKYMGDGVLVYFGYPQAHEHDAERAVQAGLAIVEAALKLVTAAGSPLHVRVGIATGLVVVGDLIGSGESRERGVVGETPNLAARLQGIAEPGTVVIAEGTRRLLGSLFELRDLGARRLRGIAGPVQAWTALRRSSVESRFEALHVSGLTPLVGREEEFELLLRRWSKAKSGEGQVVLLSGEAGIGKSRLTAAVLERLAGEPHTRLRYFCSPQHTDSAFHPIIGQMERAAGLSRHDAPQARLDKLDVVLAQTSTSMQDATLFAEMLSLANDGRYPALNLTSQQRRQATLDALAAQTEALARSRPVLMIFEDAHWADPTSLEAIGRMVDRTAALRVLLIVTFRPEFAPPWIRQPHVTALTINRLAHQEIDAMIDHVAGNKLLLADIRQDIIERTDGIPLFVEEITKAVLEAQGEGEARQTVAVIPSPTLSVPASLHASLMARLDRLGSAKELAQIGATIGREFSYALLTAVARRPEAELAESLDRLVRSGLTSRQGSPPDATYVFKHALVQDAAYGTLLREPRRALHARIAEALESQFTEIAENQPELLARHCSEAGLTEKAAGLWGKAGQRSLERSALVEAVEQLTRAIGLIAALAPTPALRREEIKLQVALITPLLHVKGYAAPETKAAAERANLLIEQATALGEPLKDPLLLYSVLYGVWVANYIAFNGDAMRELAAQFLVLAEKQGSVVPVVVAHRIMAVSLLCTGDILQARVHSDQAAALHNPAEHRPVATRFGQDNGVAILAYRSLGSWLLGYPAASLADVESAVKAAREIGQAATLMFVLAHTALAHLVSRNYAAAKGEAEELATVAGDKGAFFWKAIGTMAQGWVFALSGKASDAADLLTSGLGAFRSTGSTLWIPLHMSCLAIAHRDLDRFDEAWRCISEAMTAIETTGERWYEAEVLRVGGEIAMISPERDTAKAEMFFDRALAVARQQQAKSLELRAAMSMARVWRDRGRRDAARDLLAPVYGWFTEGFDTLDLKEAKALLDALEK
jgi:class 3 adenylate cyclase/predicted ATPase